MEQEKVKQLAEVTVRFRDRFYDMQIYKEVIGYQVGGGAVQIAKNDGTTDIWPLDLVSKVEFTLKEQQ
jgi:hypothetical protein